MFSFEAVLRMLLTYTMEASFSPTMSTFRTGLLPSFSSKSFALSLTWDLISLAIALPSTTFAIRSPRIQA